MDMLDSRSLGPTDCYAQRFMRPGRYTYNLLPAHTQALATDRPYVIEVEGDKPSGKAKQHMVRVEASRRGFSPADKTLRIPVGDIVVWHCAERRSGGVTVAGDQPFFDSARLTNECGFTHAFGLPGEYRWADAYGSDLRGVVRVVGADCSNPEALAHWQERIAQGVVVMIRDGRAEPNEVEVVVGQTVFFVLVSGPGVTITDERLIELARDIARHDGTQAGREKTARA
jgi:plastocyanin